MNLRMFSLLLLGLCCVGTLAICGRAEGADLGGLSPEKALEYMKTTKNLVIVDVATTGWYNKEHFEGAIHIPIEELGDDEEKTLFMNIPAGRPVILHCRRGVIVPGAYRRLKELRPDILEIAYIAGAPLFDEYK